MLAVIIRVCRNLQIHACHAVDSQTCACQSLFFSLCHICLRLNAVKLFWVPSIAIHSHERRQQQRLSLPALPQRRSAAHIPHHQSEPQLQSAAPHTPSPDP